MVSFSSNPKSPAISDCLAPLKLDSYSISDEGMAHAEKLLKETNHFDAADQTLFHKIKKRDPASTGRLLFNGKDLVGVLFYQREISDKYTKFGLEKSFSIQNFVAKGQAEIESQVCSELLNKAVEKAKAAQAKCLVFELKKADSKTKEFLLSKGFSQEKTFTDEKVDLLFMKLQAKKRKEEPLEEKEEKKGVNASSSSSSQTVKNDETDRQHKRHKPEEPTKPFKLDRDGGFAIGTHTAPKKANNHYTSRSKESVTGVRIKKPYLHYIQKGKKTIEGRINCGMFEKMRVDDKLRFFCGNEQVFCKITKIEKFRSFDQMLEAVDFKACIPEAAIRADAIKVYNNIPNFSDKARVHGVLALHIEKVAE